MDVKLAIDSSTHTLCVGVQKDGQSIAEVHTHLALNHSERVMPAIQQMLAQCNIQPAQLTEIIVGVGPGSYTGVRIGLTIAKTLAYTLNIPIKGVSSLEALAANAMDFNGLIVPIVDARRGQVFAGVYRGSVNGLQQVKNDELLMLDQLLASLSQEEGQILFLGTDVRVHEEKIKSVLSTRGITNRDHMSMSRAANYFYCAESKEVSDAHTIVPQYLRLAEAEAKWIQENNKSK